MGWLQYNTVFVKQIKGTQKPRIGLLSLLVFSIKLLLFFDVLYQCIAWESVVC